MKWNLPTRVILIVFLSFTSCKKDKKAEEPQPIPGTPAGPKHITIDLLLKNLDLPWSLAYLPNGDLLFSERPGRINLLKKGESTHKTIFTKQVQTNGEGGVLGVAIDPDHTTNHFVFVYMTSDSNRVYRYTLENELLSNETVIVGGIPQAQNHDGGALKFGPDGFLYIGTGDALQPNLAQDKNSLAGKILRVTNNGEPAPGNPFGNRVWTLGHRNVQGFAWTSNGKMLATEHGPSLEFGWIAHDEINLIQAGNNYGWPLALGGTETGTLTPPIVHSGDDTWAPSGCVYLNAQSIWPNCLVVAGLRSQRLIRFYLNGTGDGIISRSDTLTGQYNRLRSLTEAPDKSILVGSSNKGTISPLLPEDDKVYKIHLK